MSENVLEYTSSDLIDKKATLHIFSEATEKCVPLHVHDFIELVYVKSGEAVQYVNDERYDVRRGDVLFINYGSKHRFETESGFEYVNICFDPESFGGETDVKDKAFSALQLDTFNDMRHDLDSGRLSFFGKERELVENILSDMLLEYSRRERGWCDVLKSYANILFMHLLRCAEVDARRDTVVGVWDKLLKYIDDNLASELSLPVLAKKCFYNPSYFSRAFKEKFGMSLTKYVGAKRVERAINLLERTDMTCEEIAETVGFSSKSALYRAVIREKGTSLSDYRKK